MGIFPKLGKIAYYCVSQKWVEFTSKRKDFSQF